MISLSTLSSALNISLIISTFSIKCDFRFSERLLGKPVIYRKKYLYFSDTYDVEKCSLLARPVNVSPSRTFRLLEVDNSTPIPTNCQTRLITTSSDALHS
uniref:Cytochrome oxidase subunit II copper A binding domain-containing protein n=1 Tax=Cacopsylla melanoneura TaxID=428564 RepID=A0A8D9E9Q3_9HEMI